MKDDKPVRLSGTVRPKGPDAQNNSAHTDEVLLDKKFYPYIIFADLLSTEHLGHRRACGISIKKNKASFTPLYKGAAGYTLLHEFLSAIGCPATYEVEFDRISNDQDITQATIKINADELSKAFEKNRYSLNIQRAWIDCFKVSQEAILTRLSQSRIEDNEALKLAYAVAALPEPDYRDLQTRIYLQYSQAPEQASIQELLPSAYSYPKELSSYDSTQRKKIFLKALIRLAESEISLPPDIVPQLQATENYTMAAILQEAIRNHGCFRNSATAAGFRSQ